MQRRFGRSRNGASVFTWWELLPRCILIFSVLCSNDCGAVCQGSGNKLGTTWDVNQTWRSRHDKYSTVETSLFLGYYEIMDCKAGNNNVWLKFTHFQTNSYMLLVMVLTDRSQIMMKLQIQKIFLKEINTQRNVCHTKFLVFRLKWWPGRTDVLSKTQNICSPVMLLYNAFLLDTSDFTMPEVIHWDFIEVFSRTRRW